MTSKKDVKQFFWLSEGSFKNAMWDHLGKENGIIQRWNEHFFTGVARWEWVGMEEDIEWYSIQHDFMAASLVNPHSPDPSDTEASLCPCYLDAFFDLWDSNSFFESWDLWAFPYASWTLHSICSLSHFSLHSGQWSWMFCMVMLANAWQMSHAIAI